jgi:septal ring factor EnvC (AmiA/AmiB activator)
MLQRRTGVCVCLARHCCAALNRGIRADLRARIAQADSDVDALGAMLRETQQEQGDRIISLEKKVASLESENSGLQQLLRISIDDTTRLKAEKEAALKQLRHAEVGITCHV